MGLGWLNNPMTQTYTIGLESGGFRGQKSGFSNNDLLPGESPNMYNYLASDSGLTKRKGRVNDNATELVAATAITGLHRHFDGFTYHTFAKCGTRLFDVQATGNSPFLLIGITEAGDASNQMSLWSLTGAGNANTNNGVLYWKLTDGGGIRTVQLYKKSDGAAENLVAMGSKVGDGSVSLAEQNSSGLSGSVSVSYSSDDTTLAANTLTFTELAAATEVVFVSWFSKYFATDGITLYSGTTGGLSAVTLLDEDGHTLAGVMPHGLSMLVHRERLWMTRDPDYPTRVYFSVTDFFDRFDTAGGVDVTGWVACDKDDGIAITGFIQYNDKLLVMKSTKAYWILGDWTAGDLAVIDAFPNGAWDQKTIINCDDGIVRWYGPGGVWEYADGMGLPRHISRNIDYDLEQIPVAYRAKACAIYYDHYYVLWYPWSFTSTYNDRGYVYDTHKQAWYPLRGWSISRLVRFEDDSLHGGLANEGYVSNLFSGYEDNGVAITAFYESRREGIPGIEQCLYSFQVFNVKAGGETIFGWGSDLGSHAGGSYAIPYSGKGARLGHFILGHDVVVSNSDIVSDANSPSRRCDNGQRFFEIYFTVTETGKTAHSIGYIVYKAYPVREVM